MARWLAVVLLAFVGISGAVVAGMGRADAQTPDLDRGEAIYLGWRLAMERITVETTADIEALIQRVDPGWYELGWQNDMIGEAAVLTAVHESGAKMEPPPRFAGSHAEVLLAAEARHNYGLAARQAIETGATQVLLDATRFLAEAKTHDEQAADIVRAEMEGQG